MFEYRLEKLIDGEWYTEGTYTEGYFITHLANAAFNLGKYSSVEDIRVVIIKNEEIVYNA